MMAQILMQSVLKIYSLPVARYLADIQASKFVSQQHTPLNRFRWQTRKKLTTSSWENFHYTLTSELNNGMRIVTTKNYFGNNNNDSQCLIGLFIEAGTRYEHGPRNFAAAQLMHRIMIDDSKIGLLSKTGTELRSINGSIGSWLTREHLIVHINCQSTVESIGKAIKILSQLTFDMIEGRFGDECLEKQREIVLDQLEQLDDEKFSDYQNFFSRSNLEETLNFNPYSSMHQSVVCHPKRIVLDLMHTAAYQGTALGTPLLGTKKAIEHVTHQTIVDHVSTNFRGPQTALVVLGGPSIDHEQIVRFVDKSFSQLSGLHLGLYYPSQSRPCRFTGSDIRIRDDAMSHAHVIIATEGSGYGPNNEIANLVLIIASTMAGSWHRYLSNSDPIQSPESSNKLRTSCAKPDSGILCYESFNIAYADTGLWGCYFVADRTHQEDMIYYLQQTWISMCSQLTRTQLEQTKAKLITQLITLYERSPLLTLHYIGQRSLLQSSNHSGINALTDIGQDLSDPIKLIKRIESINLKTFKHSLIDNVYDRCPVVSALGPIENLDDYSRIRSGMYWLRM